MTFIRLLPCAAWEKVPKGDEGLPATCGNPAVKSLTET